MNWLNLRTSRLRDPSFIGSDPVERGTWLCVIAYCVELENGGRIIGAKLWKDRQWQQACGVTLKEVMRSERLLKWEGEDLIVWEYPSIEEDSKKLTEIEDRREGMPEPRKRRQARIRRARGIGTHTREQWESMLRDFNFSCASCMATLKIQKDHIQPVSKNGSDSIENLQPLCLRCNVQKGTKTIDFRKSFVAL